MLTRRLNTSGAIPVIVITGGSFATLIKVFRDFALHNVVVHQNSNPLEVKKFILFMEQCRKQSIKYDLIVDGPNVNFKAFPSKIKLNRQEANKLQGRNLYQTVKYFHDLDWKILIIHKGHFKSTQAYRDLSELG